MSVLLKSQDHTFGFWKCDAKMKKIERVRTMLAITINVFSCVSTSPSCRFIGCPYTLCIWKSTRLWRIDEWIMLNADSAIDFRCWDGMCDPPPNEIILCFSLIVLFNKQCQCNAPKWKYSRTIGLNGLIGRYVFVHLPDTLIILIITIIIAPEDKSAYTARSWTIAMIEPFFICFATDGKLSKKKSQTKEEKINICELHTGSCWFA